MSKIDEWKKSKQVREQSEQWLGMRTAIARYNGGLYVPRMDVHATMYMCGQEYAGAKNYHEPPASLVDAFCATVSKDWLPIALTALEVLKERERTALIAAQEELDEASQQLQELKAMEVKNG